VPAALVPAAPRPVALGPAALVPAALAAPIVPDVVDEPLPAIKRRKFFTVPDPLAAAPDRGNPYDYGNSGDVDPNARLPPLRSGKPANPYDLGANNDNGVITNSNYQPASGGGGRKNTRRKNINKKRSRKIKKGKREGRKKSRKLKKIITRKKKRVQKVQKGGVVDPFEKIKKGFKINIKEGFEKYIKEGFEIIDRCEKDYSKDFNLRIPIISYLPIPYFAWGVHYDYEGNSRYEYQNKYLPITFFILYFQNIEELAKEIIAKFPDVEKIKTTKLLKEKLNTPELFDMSDIYILKKDFRHVKPMGLKQTWKLYEHILKDENKYNIDKLDEIQFKDYVNNFINKIVEYAGRYLDWWNSETNKDRNISSPPGELPNEWNMTHNLDSYFDSYDYNKQGYIFDESTIPAEYIKRYSSIKHIFSEKEQKVFINFQRGADERIGEKHRLIHLLFGVHQLKRYFVCRLLQELNGWTKKVEEAVAVEEEEAEEEAVKEAVKEAVEEKNKTSDEKPPPAEYDVADYDSVSIYSNEDDTEDVDTTPQGFPSDVNENENSGYLHVGEDTSPPGSNKGGKRKYNKRYTRRKNRGKPPAKQALRPH
jgi:hypothetical protein